MERGTTPRETIPQHPLEWIQDPVVVVTSTGEVGYANRAARKIFSLEPSDTFSSLQRRAAGVGFDPGQLARLVTGSGNVFNRLIKRHGRKRSDVAVDVVCLDKLGRGAKLIHFKDLSPFEHRERWKDETISMLSHELKNPLSAMKNALGLLLSRSPGPLTSDQERFLETAARSIDRLTHLLESILDVSRLDSGRLEVKPAWVEVESFLARVVRTFESLFNVRRLEINWSLEEGITRAFIDPAKLEQVLINLLSNAVKFTPAGGRVDLEVGEGGIDSLSTDYRLLPWPELPRPRFLRFQVSDNGIGMNEDTLANLFSRYHKSRGAPPAGGSHLGLSIAKTLVEVQGGRLEVESELGIGTKVSFYLPMDERTSYLLACFGAAEAMLGETIGRGGGAVLVCLAKESGECWLELAGSWPVQPELNPTPEFEPGGQVMLWPLSEYLALGLAGESNWDASAALGAERLTPDGTAVAGSCYVAGFARAPREGERFVPLVNLALKRMKKAAGRSLGPLSGDG